MYFFARLRIDLQIGIFGIIAQGSDFSEIALQNCKSDMTTPLGSLNSKNGLGKILLYHLISTESQS
jgi:hypothetical protein